MVHGDLVDELMARVRLYPAPIADEIRRLPYALDNPRRMNTAVLRVCYVLLQYIAQVGWWDYVASKATEAASSRRSAPRRSGRRWATGCRCSRRSRIATLATASWPSATS